MQSNLEARIHPLLAPGEALLQIENTDPRYYTLPTVRAWLAAVTFSAILTLMALLWIDTPQILLLLFMPPFLSLATAIVQQDKEKEVLHSLFTSHFSHFPQRIATQISRSFSNSACSFPVN